MLTIMELTPEKQIQLLEDVATTKQAVLDIKELFINLPCKAHETKMEEIKEFQDNLKGKITIIAAIGVVVGGFLMWLAEEIIRKFIGK